MKFAAGREHRQKKNPLNVCLYFKKQRAMALVDDWLSSGRLLLDCYWQICVQYPSDKQTDLMFSDYKVRKTQWK